MSAVAEPAIAVGAPDVETGERVIRRCIWRVVTLLILTGFLQAIDRVNVAYAALQMNSDLGFSASVFGVGAGLFFVTYVLCGVPSNLALVRFGARRWLTFSMIAWGSASVAMAFVHDATSFYIARLLLGASEAGVTPTLFYLAGVWFPDSHRGRVLATLSTINPLAALIGAPISGVLLGIEALGLRGWQWMFILEGLPTVVLAVIVWLLMRDSPADAEWLDAHERAWLENQVRVMPAGAAARQSEFSWQGLFSPRVLALSATLFGAASIGFSVMFFLPQIIKQMGLSDFQAVMASALPPATGVVAMLLWGRHSDRTGERAWHTLAGLVTAIVGVLVTSSFSEPVVRMVGLCITVGGAYAFMPCFWTFPGRFLTGAAAAAGIAMINSVGSISGFIGPSLMGTMRDLTGSFDWGLRVTAVLAACGALAFVGFVRSTKTDPAFARTTDT
jgi:ACS family tartrate transporter-like MFS transporter